MKTKITLLFILPIFLSLSLYGQDKRARIKDYLNQELMIEDNFAGQSITLIKEKHDYFILRQFFGSGVPVLDSVKYKVVFKSDYMITFSEITEPSTYNRPKDFKEDFILSVKEEGLCLYLNYLKVVLRPKNK